MLAPKISPGTEVIGDDNVGVLIGLTVGGEEGVLVGIDGWIGVGRDVDTAVGTGVGGGVGVGITAVRARIKVFDSPEELVLFPENRLSFTS